MYKLDLKLVRG